jgi:hypothetical protein
MVTVSGAGGITMDLKVDSSKGTGCSYCVIAYPTDISISRECDSYGFV